MQTFGEQLTAARKAKGMTQEALSQAAAVTRQTVSSWERGRTIPDIDTVRHLSGILGVDLLQADSGQDATPAMELAAGEQPAPLEEREMPVAAGGRRIKKWWIVVGVAALACIMLVCLLLLPHRSAPKLDTAYYTRETPNEAGKAYLTFFHKTWIENNGGQDYQMYEFTLKEKNGVAFSITRIETQMEGKSGAIKEMTLSAEHLATFTNPEMPEYGDITITGGFPKGEFLRLGIAAYGNDANGEPMAFYHLIEF